MQSICGILHGIQSRAQSNLGFAATTLMLAAMLMPACSENDPFTPPDASEPNPPVYVWNPADFTHVYEVGPNLDYSDPSDVPWESLQPSSLVRIHWRSEPYRAKWVLNSAATAEAPVVVLGIANGNRRPVISGEDAVTRLELSYWNEVRSVIKVGGSNLPSDSIVPSHIYIQGLEIRSARPPYAFTDDNGLAQNYAENAAAIHVEVGEHITIHDCILHDAANGLFAGSQTTDLVISGNHVFNNGMEGSIYQHNSYTECLGILFEYNHYGPLRNGCLGNNLKDRSAGTVIRYNWIESGNRQLDLVETDYDYILADPTYDVTFVYGNILVEPDGAGNSQILHYGGDGGNTNYYRRGILYFYHNSVISTRDGNTTLMRCSTNDVQVDLRNNIFMNSAEGFRFAITSGQGQIELRNNWLPEGWRDTHEPELEGTIAKADNIEGEDPEFEDFTNQDFSLGPGSTCLDSAGALPPGVSDHPVTRQYVRHQRTEAREDEGASDVGAFERQGE